MVSMKKGLKFGKIISIFLNLVSFFLWYVFFISNLWLVYLVLFYLTAFHLLLVLVSYIILINNNFFPLIPNSCKWLFGISLVVSCILVLSHIFGHGVYLSPLMLTMFNVLLLKSYPVKLSE